MGKPLAGSVRIPLIYVVVGLVWIVLSSIWVRDALVIDAELLKGSAFVLVTAAGLAFLLRRDEARELELRDTVELAESRLAAGDSLIRAIESAVPSGIVTFDREGRVRSWSPSMSRLLGWSAEERVGEQLPGLRAENRTELVRIVGRVSSTGMPARLNIAVSRNDGTDADLVCEFAVLSHNARLSDDAPVIAALTDISEIEGLRREVADVAERWRLGVEAVGEGVLDWDLASGQVSLSPRARALIGAPSGPATFAPSDLWEFVWEADAPAIRASRDRLLDTHGTEQLTFRVHSRQHAFRWLRQTAVVALDASG